MSVFQKLFRHQQCNVIGMLHIPALPGTPASSLTMPEIMDKVEQETLVYKETGVDGVIIENMHDTPYCQARDLEPHISSCMAVIGARVRSLLPRHLPVGVQILAAANKEALSVALAADLQFVRAEGFVFSHVADEGWMDASAGPLLRYRRSIGAENVAIVCDIKKKHSAHTVTADVDVVETARAAQFFRSDGVIITGNSTGHQADPDQLHDVLHHVPDLPVLVGSGVTAENLHHFRSAHSLIIGSEFKIDGHWQNDLDPQRIKTVVDEARKYREV